MSAHIVWEPFLMPANSTPASTIATIKSRLLAGGYQVVREDAASAYVDVVPPSSQSIGGNGHREVLRIYAPAGGSTLQLWSYMETTIARYHSFGVHTGPYYTSSYNSYFQANNRVIIDGTPLQGPSTGLSTADATLEALFAVLSTSSEPVAQLYDWTYTDPSSGVNDAYIVATARAPGAHTVEVVTNSSGRPTLVSYRDGANAGDIVGRTLTPGASLTVDYTYGFVVYLEQMARTLHLGVRTNSAFNGPAAATWVDHAAALAATPTECSPIELLIADLTSADTAYTKAPVVTTHLWGLVPLAPAYRAPYVNYQTPLYYPPPSDWRTPAAAYMYPTSIYGGPDRTGEVRVEDVLSYSVSTLGTIARMIPAVATAAGIPDGQSAYRRYIILGSPTVARLWMGAQQTAAINYVGSEPTGALGAYALPSLPLHDVYAFPGSATNESIHLAEHETISTTLVTAMDGSSDYSMLELTDASSFPNAGAMILGGEKITWTGRSGNVLSGVARAQYGSAKAAHAAGSTVKLGTWFVKLNGAAIPVGTSKPTV